MRIRSEQSALLVVDLHERLARVICTRDQVVANSVVLLRAARTLGVPVVVSEHCPPQLGPTLPEVLQEGSDASIVAKTHFSCADEPAVAERVLGLGRPQLVVCGMEAHVCVLQTALGFQERGFEVFVVRDASGSRTAESHRAGIERLTASGVQVVTTEMVVFEWLKRADRPEFRELLKLIK